ncbi:RluA family pseudouridine synthase [Blastomonas sp.]|uniref:RluA family pseudouridine synthase n=1 Tax=Blastomonas sp. TaxID=1909299 RepID=UPI003593531E
MGFHTPAFCVEANLPFIDGEALVINKPAGLPVSAPRKGGRSLDDYLTDLRFGFQRAPMPVHRLDQDTSGCLLLARNTKAVKRFGDAFAAAAVDKLYLGVIAGDLAEDSGTIDFALGKTSTQADGWRIVPDTNGKHAVTHWRRVSAHDGFTLVEFRPETGRTHQIRVHALHGLGVALLGDPFYGQPHPSGLMLHASRLGMQRAGKADIDAFAPLPQRFAALGFTDAGVAQPEPTDG